MKPKFKLSTWYVYCFISEFVLIYPVYLIMMENSGIDAIGIATLLMLWSGATLLFELPTGVIGDLFPRKTVLLIAGLLDAVAFLCWLMWPEFWGFALGFVIWSLAGALASGTAEAYLYEVMDQPETFPQVYGRTEAIESVGVAGALLLGGFAASLGFDLVLMLSIAGPLVGVALLAFFLPGLPVKNSTPGAATGFADFIPTLQHAWVVIKSNHKLITIIAISAVLAALAGVYEEYVGVLLNELAFDLSSVGIVYAAVWLARAGGSYFAERLTGLYLPLIIYASTAMLLVAALLIGHWSLIIALMLFFAASGALEVVYGASLQSMVMDESRATVTSVQSLLMEGIAVLAFLSVGILATDAAWLPALLSLAAFAVATSAIGLVIGRVYGNFTHKTERT